MRHMRLVLQDAAVSVGWTILGVVSAALGVAALAGLAFGAYHLVRVLF